jgi:membrane associated rhomboid family serine protease
MVRLPRVRIVNVLGAYLPSTLVGLIAALIGMTVLGVLLQNTALPLVSLGELVPERVFHGQLWRLVTWTFLELHPLGLIFSCVLLAFLGRDLSNIWGYWRFVFIYVGFAAAVGVATCLLSLAWPTLRVVPQRTAWALCDALLIAWATYFPSRQILVYFVIPLAGRNLIYLTIGGTALFALFSSFVLYVPHFLAIGLSLWLTRGTSFTTWWLRLRYAIARSKTRRGSDLRVVRKPPADEPPRWLH